MLYSGKFVRTEADVSLGNWYALAMGRECDLFDVSSALQGKCGFI